MVETAIGLGEDAVLDDPLLWSCLTCNQCTEICPSLVSFSDFIQNVREVARDQNRSSDCTHSGMIQTWGRMMTDPELKQDRLDWIENDLKTCEESDTVYFTGCLPYYDAAFDTLKYRRDRDCQSCLKDTQPPRY